MVKKTLFCDICGNEIDGDPDKKAVSIEEMGSYLRTPKIGFTISLDVCRGCQSAIQETIDRLSGANVKR